MDKSDKQSLRRWMLGRRNALSPADHARDSRRVSGRIIAYLQQELFSSGRGKPSNGVLAAFMPHGSELDITPVIEWAWEQRLAVLFPKTGLKGAMAFHRVDGFADFAMGRFGLREPRPETAVWPATGGIDAMLVPGLVFDPFGGRIGYGRGYYDRFLAERKKHGRIPVLIAPAFSFQVVDFRLPVEEHDAAIEHIVTESAWIGVAPVDAGGKNS